MFNADYVIVFWYDVLFVEQSHRCSYVILNSQQRKPWFQMLQHQATTWCSNTVHFPSLWQSCLCHLLAKIKDQPESRQTLTDHIVLVWKCLYTAGPKWMVYLSDTWIWWDNDIAQLRITTTYLHILIILVHFDLNCSIKIFYYFFQLKCQL